LALHSALAWVSTTPLGREVVPEVYWIHAGSWAETSPGAPPSGSPRSEEKASPESTSSKLPASGLATVDTTQRALGTASWTVGIRLGWVITPTAPECSPK